jgi:hypothetical protein
MASPSQDSTLGGSTAVLVSEPTIIEPSETVFATRVSTSLPYWQMTTRLLFNYWAVMIDEDCLVGHVGRRPNFIEVCRVGFAAVIHYINISQGHPDSHLVEVLCI